MSLLPSIRVLVLVMRRRTDYNASYETGVVLLLPLIYDDGLGHLAPDIFDAVG